MKTTASRAIAFFFGLLVVGLFLSPPSYAAGMQVTMKVDGMI